MECGILCGINYPSSQDSSVTLFTLFINSHQFAGIASITITPTHHRMALDAHDGMRSWSLRPASSECRLCVLDVRLFRSADSDNENDDEEEEEGHEGDVFSNGKGERVVRVKKPPPLRVRLDKTEVQYPGRVGERSCCVWVPVCGCWS